MEPLKMLLGFIYIAWSWSSINYLQNEIGLSFFVTFNGLMQFVVIKLVLAIVFGWLAIPIVLIHKALRK